MSHVPSGGRERLSRCEGLQRLLGKTKGADGAAGGTEAPRTKTKLGPKMGGVPWKGGEEFGVAKAKKKETLW